MQQQALRQLVENAFKMNAMMTVTKEEIQKIERDLKEVRQLAQNYRAPTQTAEKKLELLLVQKYNLLNQLETVCKVSQIQAQQISDVVAQFE